MYIIEIILEGFKSYKARTTIKGFDPQFNAIIGLNGSGKSNVMDSILFLLGLSKNLDIMRVSKLDELIYKGGQAGVIKAEVSIRFDNRNKQQSPIGFESQDEITVTRQITTDKSSKYFIGGAKYTIGKVKSFFRSIQLNVDNPHFYIAQGQIKRISNLKQSELISLLEETAGTALYNEKKLESIRTMQKKDEKIKEIDKMIEKDIDPQMDKLKKEKEQYILYNSQNIEVTRLNRELRAFEYYIKQKFRAERQGQILNLQELDSEKRNDKQRIQKELTKIESELKLYLQKKTKESDTEYEKISSLCAQLQKDLWKKETDVKNLKSRIDDYEKEQQTSSELQQDKQYNIKRILQKLDFIKSNLSQSESTLKQKKDVQEEAVRNIDAYAKGQSSVEDAKEGLKQQINEAEQNKRMAKSKHQQILQKIEHKQKDLQMYSNEAENREMEGKSILKQKEILEREIKQLNDEIMNSNFNESDYERIKQQRRQIEEDIIDCQNKAGSVINNWAFKLQYRDPEANFDRKKVKGRVFSLIQPKQHNFIKALEQGAGGKLRNIVVDNENTSKQLLQRRCFDNFEYLIPNSKIQYRELPRNAVENAKKIAAQMGGWALPAYEAINFNQELKPSIYFVFGSFFIASSSEIAKKIAYNTDRSLSIKCVTVEGDILDPSGTLTGGYINQDNLILPKYQQFREMNAEIEKYKQQKEQLDRDLSDMRQQDQNLNGLREDLANKKYKLEKLDQQIRSQTGFEMKEKKVQLTKEIEDLNQERAHYESRAEAYEKELEDLQSELVNLSSSKDISKDLKHKQSKMKEEVKKLEREVKKNKDQISNMEVEKENLEQEIRQIQDKLVTGQRQLEQDRAQLTVDSKTLNNLKQELDKHAKTKEKLEKEMQMVDSKLRELEQAKKKTTEELEKTEEDIKRNDNKLKKTQKEIQEASDQMNTLEETFDFIKSDKDRFGMQGSEYDFTNFEYEIQERNLEEKKLDLEKLKKKVNFKVEIMSDQVEKDFKILKDKKQKILEHKATIEFDIAELDKKKKETLEKCWLQVNKNFGLIFSDMLKGAQAKLQPIEGKDITEGLEISVAFKDHWRSSLSELSGGQRSLLALSLILALLKYKPAPFYLLDEIDAALDQSHAENIGQMIKNQFPYSQFILISHQNGIFSNANVIFRATFDSGISKIERISMKQVTNDDVEDVRNQHKKK